MYYTYVLRNNKTNRYYIGYTPDLKNRLMKHKSGKVLSTKSNLNYELEWYCAFKTKGQALSFEQYLKTGSGVAFMKKRFFKSEAFAKLESMGSPATRSSKSEV
ncbi:MAG TPA: GIY-YIG nuclease family protein [Patescibacteria group bacterium]|nr:GIY-YIG nuclease family protein [Patescibacteria group bacterium]